MEELKLFKKYGKKKIIEIIKNALEKGKDFGLDKSFIVTEVSVKNRALLVYYKSKLNNRFLIYNDFASIISFIYSFLVGEFEENQIYNIGIHTKFSTEGELYILSPIESAKAISVGNAIYWLKNSRVNENITYPSASYLLVEGESEIAAFPILFKTMNIQVEQYKITVLVHRKTDNDVPELSW